LLPETPDHHCAKQGYSSGGQRGKAGTKWTGKKRIAGFGGGRIYWFVVENCKMDFP
jgi:hypothetical protein